MEPKTMLSSVLLALFAFVVATEARSSSYNIVSRNAERHLQVPANGPTARPTIPSFDGDLDSLVILAMQRASENASPNLSPTTSPGSGPPSAGTVPTIAPGPSEIATDAPASGGLLVPVGVPTGPPAEFSGSATTAPTKYPTASPSAYPTISFAPTVSHAPTPSPVLSPNQCDGAEMNRLVLVDWKYTIETVPNANIDKVIGEVEEMLQESLVPLLLECKNDEAASATIVVVDCTLPRDVISENSEYFPCCEQDTWGAFLIDLQ